MIIAENEEIIIVENMEEEEKSIHGKQKDSTESKQLNELEIAAPEEDKQDDKKEEQSVS